MRGPLGHNANWAWSREHADAMGPNIWEGHTDGTWNTHGRHCTFSRTLAASGIVTWADITDPATGSWLNCAAAQRKYAFKNGDCETYRRMIAELNAPELAPCRGGKQCEAASR